MATPADSSYPLTELIAYLFTRREAIMTNWRVACEQDPTLGKISSMSREEFNNLLPVVLDLLEQRLLNKPLEADPAITAQAHGLHRWHKSLGLMDTMRELNHLTRILFNELNLFRQLFPQRDVSLLLDVQQQITSLMQETVSGSVQKYDELQRLQATNRANALQQAINQMEELARQRADSIRTSTHDLRGSFGIINSAAYILRSEELSEAEREQFMNMLSRNLAELQTALTSLMDLSRLEAGQEHVQVELIDAAQLLIEMVASAQPMATERGIVLQADGPASLMVETDRVKLQRIVQNLLDNALQYTYPTPERPAIVSISWSAQGDFRWVFSIQDSGPGLPATTVGILGQQLRPTVEPVALMEPNQAEPVVVLPEDVPRVPPPSELNQLPNPSSKGEGVGLQIVKRLCDLLNANIDLETKEGRGTLIRIRLLIHPVA